MSPFLTEGPLAFPTPGDQIPWWRGRPPSIILTSVSRTNFYKSGPLGWSGWGMGPVEPPKGRKGRDDTPVLTKSRQEVFREGVVLAFSLDEGRKERGRRKNREYGSSTSHLQILITTT